MDRITKFLNKISERERIRIERVIEKIYAGDAKGLDIKKLKHHPDFFRVRVGDVRIVYTKEKNIIKILVVEYKSKDTYKF